MGYDGKQDPATAKQKIAIARLSMALGNRGDAVEESQMTKGQAGFLISKMLQELEMRKAARRGMR